MFVARCVLCMYGIYCPANSWYKNCSLRITVYFITLSQDLAKRHGLGVRHVFFQAMYECVDQHRSAQLGWYW